MYKYIMARLTVNLTLLGVLATLPLSQGHGLVARPTEENPSPARSYHLHVQFVAGAEASTAKALKLRRAYQARWGNKTCTGLFDQAGLCLYPVDHAPNGPFISGNWAAFLPTENYEAVLAWITRRRGDLSILFHPNSGHVVHPLCDVGGPGLAPERRAAPLERQGPPGDLHRVGVLLWDERWLGRVGTNRQFVVTSRSPQNPAPTCAARPTST